ncbi:hypothetical protein [Paenibacillus sp. FSL H8-0034]|uniref:hypothetical protein n=1 Tax=Paenibacillus sp. FSL H8-0034 TaxID=2954671 RepID=UPI0030F6895A
MVNEAAVISKEEAVEVLTHYMVRVGELKQSLEVVERDGDGSAQAWIDLTEKYALIENDIRKHYAYISSGGTFGMKAAFFEAAIKDMYVSLTHLNMDMNAKDAAPQLGRVLVEIDGYSRFWMSYSNRI